MHALTQVPDALILQVMRYYATEAGPAKLEVPILLDPRLSSLLQDTWEVDFYCLAGGLVSFLASEAPSRRAFPLQRLQVQAREQALEPLSRSQVALAWTFCFFSIISLNLISANQSTVKVHAEAGRHRSRRTDSLPDPAYGRKKKKNRTTIWKLQGATSSKLWSINDLLGSCFINKTDNQQVFTFAQMQPYSDLPPTQQSGERRRHRWVSRARYHRQDCLQEGC